MFPKFILFCSVFVLLNRKTTMDQIFTFCSNGLCIDIIRIRKKYLTIHKSKDYNRIKVSYNKILRNQTKETKLHKGHDLMLSKNMINQMGREEPIFINP